jgi:hypothetical protein
MKRNPWFVVVAGLLLAFSLPGMAQELGFWRAASKEAQSTTGDVAFSDFKISINYAGFTIVRVRDLAPGEVSSVFDADSNSGAKGHLYKLNIPASKRFLHKNSLCGSEDTEWMATFVEGRSLHVAFFSGEKPPVFTVDAISNSTDLCGVYTYGR